MGPNGLRSDGRGIVYTVVLDIFRSANFTGQEVGIELRKIINYQIEIFGICVKMVT